VITIVLSTLTVVGALVWFLSRSYQKPTIESFLVSNRNIPFLLGTTAVLATWTHVFALIVGATFAYRSQWHLFWFLVPNVSALIVLGVFAPKIQDAIPKGYTLPQVVGKAFGPNVRTVYALSAFGSLVYIVASTMTALSQWIGQQLGTPPWQISVIIGIFAFSWVIRRGLPAAVIGDSVKVALIMAGILGVLALHLYHSDTTPLTRISQSPISFGGTFWMLGIPLFVTLIAAALCNADIGERVYAINRRKVRYSYLFAAVLFAVIVGTYGSIGFLAKNLGMSLSNTEPPALAVLQATMSQWILFLVTVVLIVVLVSTLASMIGSAGDLTVIEIYQRFINKRANNAETVRWGRIFMTMTVVLGTLIATLNLDLSLLIQSMAVIRGEVIIPMLLALFWPLIAPGRYVFWGMITGVLGGITITFGGPLWQNVFSQSTAQFIIANSRPFGALFTLFAPLGFCLLAVTLRRVGALTLVTHRDV